MSQNSLSTAEIALLATVGAIAVGASVYTYQNKCAANDSESNLQESFSCNNLSSVGQASMVQPEAYHAKNSLGQGNVAAFGANYPNETNPMGDLQSSKGQTGCMGGSAPQYTGFGLSNLMPGGSTQWREAGCPTGTDPADQWANYSVNRNAYERYIIASGSARLGINTRDKSAKIIGLTNLFRSTPSVPLNTASYNNDSDARIMAVNAYHGYNAINGSHTNTFGN